MTTTTTGPPPADLASAFRLDGRLAVVTGAASGIGRQTAVTLSEAGAAAVVIADRDESGLADTAAQIEAAGGKAVAVPTDVGRKADVDALAAEALRLGAIDVWANVAGILRPAAVLDTDEALLELTLRVNLAGALWGAAAAARSMVEAGRGSIISVASASGEMASPGAAAYGMSKAGVISLTRTLATEIGPRGVRVNAVAPGMVDTPMTAPFFARQATGDIKRGGLSLEARATGTPIATIGQPIDIALCILYLASDASRFVTGQVLRPNGGMVLG